MAAWKCNWPPLGLDHRSGASRSHQGGVGTLSEKRGNSVEVPRLYSLGGQYLDMRYTRKVSLIQKLKSRKGLLPIHLNGIREGFKKPSQGISQR